MTARDPRIDPEPGDFIAVKGYQFTVEAVNGDRVSIEKVRPGGDLWYGFIPLDEWRRDLAEASKEKAE